MIVKSCGYCGSPIDENGRDVWPVPDGYDPDKYPHDVCVGCANQEQEHHEEYLITHEMALDAGDPDLEGQPY